MSNLSEQLSNLTALYQAGQLTGEEYKIAKARVLRDQSEGGKPPTTQPPPVYRSNSELSRYNEEGKRDSQEDNPQTTQPLPAYPPAYPPADPAARVQPPDLSISAQPSAQRVQPTVKGVTDLRNPNRVRLPYNFERKTLLREHKNAPQRLVDAGLTQDEWETFRDRLRPIHTINETAGVKCLRRLAFSGGMCCGLSLLCCLPCAYENCKESRKKKAMGEWADDFNAQVLHKYQIYLKLHHTDRHVEKRIEGELPQDYTMRVTALIFALGDSEIEILKST